MTFCSTWSGVGFVFSLNQICCRLLFSRSLLTTPWVEAGGNGTISCAKTGFTTDIEFFTKSMFSSERNKIKAKMTGPKTTSAKDATSYEGRLYR